MDECPQNIATMKLLKYIETQITKESTDEFSARVTQRMKSFISSN